MTRFGQRVTKARVEYGKGMKEAELARQIGMTPDLLNKWVNKREPKVDFNLYVKIANVLSCPLHELLEPESVSLLREVAVDRSGSSTIKESNVADYEHDLPEVDLRVIRNQLADLWVQHKQGDDRSGKVETAINEMTATTQHQNTLLRELTSEITRLCEHLGRDDD